MYSENFLRFTNDLQDEINKETVKLNGLSVNSLKIEVGRVKEKLNKVLLSVAPYSAVLFVATEKTYLESARQIFSLIKGAGSIPVGIIVNDERIISVEDLARLFGFSASIRAIITAEPNLSGMASYFAGVRGIEHICLCFHPRLRNVLDCSVFIKTDGKLERIVSNVSRTLIIDETSARQEVNASLILSDAITALTALYDYRLYLSAYSIKGSKAGYRLIKEGIEQSLSLKNNSTENYLINSLKAEVGNFLSGGIIFDNSAVMQYRTLYNVIGYGGKIAEPIAFKPFLDLYLYKVDVNLITDGAVIKGIKRIANDIGVSERFLYQRRLEIINKVNQNKNAINYTKNNISKEVKNNLASVERLIEKTKENSKTIRMEKEEKMRINAISRFPFGYNITTLIDGRVREHYERMY